MLIWVILFLKWRVIFAEKCIFSNTSLKCVACKHLFYEKDYVESLKLTVSSGSFIKESDCLLKNLTLNSRKVLIKNKPCFDCEEFDAKYDNLVQAFEEESRIAIKFNFLKIKLIFNLIDI